MSKDTVAVSACILKGKIMELWPDFFLGGEETPVAELKGAAAPVPQSMEPLNGREAQRLLKLSLFQSTWNSYRRTIVDELFCFINQCNLGSDYPIKFLSVVHLCCLVNGRMDLYINLIAFVGDSFST